MKRIKIGEKIIGNGMPCFIIGEIGINHNGDVELAKKIINAASVAGFDAVKFQKRTVDVVYSEEELLRPRESPFGNTNGDLKRGLEFNERNNIRLSMNTVRNRDYMVCFLLMKTCRFY